MNPEFSPAEKDVDLKLENKQETLPATIESNEAFHEKIEGENAATLNKISSLESSLNQSAGNQLFEKIKSNLGYDKVKSQILKKIADAKQIASDSFQSLSKKEKVKFKFEESEFSQLLEADKEKKKSSEFFIANPAIWKTVDSLLKNGDLLAASKAIEIAESKGQEFYHEKNKLIQQLCDTGNFEFALSKAESRRPEETKIAEIVLNAAAKEGKLNDPRVIAVLKGVLFAPDGRRNFISKQEAGEFLKSITLNAPKAKGRVPKEALDFVYNGFRNIPLNETDPFLGYDRMEKQEYEKFFEKFYQDTDAQLERMKNPESGEYMAIKDMYSTEQPIEAAYYNLKAMRDLESKSPGVVTALYKEFGIRAFQRYPSEVLLAQNENKNTDMNYGVALHAVSDHNANLSRDRKAFLKLFNDLPENYGLRISEAMQKKEVVARLHSYDKKYGAKNKIGFLILGGHGQPGEINMGDSGKDHRDKMVTSDLHNPVVKKLNTYFDKDASIIMNSCLTGAKGGFAETLSNQTNKEVTASTEIISDSVYTVSNENGKVKLDVNYTKLGQEGKVHFNPKENHLQ